MEITPAALQQRFYDDNHGDSLTHRSNTTRAAIAVKLISKVPVGKLLDVGCSDGSVTELFRPFALSGVDVSPQAVLEARAKGIDARCADIGCGLPFDDAGFDLVFAGETIEHAVRTDFFLSECNRVLRPGGHLLFTTPNVNSVASWLMMGLLDLPPYGSARYRSPHVRDFTTKLLKLALRNNGFATLEMRGTWLGLPWPAGIERILGPLEAAIAFAIPRIAAGLVILARKTSTVLYDPAVEIQTTLGKPGLH